jgi:hypothetical protein
LHLLLQTSPDTKVHVQFGSEVQLAGQVPVEGAQLLSEVQDIGATVTVVVFTVAFLH